jgi:hypothetical protein
VSELCLPQEIFGIVVAILHIGNLSFDQSSHAGDEAAIFTPSCRVHVEAIKQLMVHCCVIYLAPILLCVHVIIDECYISVLNNMFVETLYLFSFVLLAMCLIDCFLF